MQIGGCTSFTFSVKQKLGNSWRHSSIFSIIWQVYLMTCFWWMLSKIPSSANTWNTFFQQCTNKWYSIMFYDQNLIVLYLDPILELSPKISLFKELMVWWLIPWIKRTKQIRANFGFLNSWYQYCQYILE